MTDFLDEFSDDDIIDTSHFAAVTALALQTDNDSQTSYLLRGIAEGLAVLQERRKSPTNVVLWAAQQRFDGVINDDEFTDVMARETLRHQGISEPSADQIAERVSELNTANSFIGAIRGE